MYFGDKLIFLKLDSEHFTITIVSIIGSTFNILYTEQIKSNGFRNGYITNCINFSNTIKKVIKKCEYNYSISINRIYLIVNADYLTLSLNSYNINIDNHQINLKKLHDLINKKSDKYIYFHSYIFNYKLDDIITDNPENMTGKSLEVKTSDLFISNKQRFPLLNVIDEIERSDLEIIDIIPLDYCYYFSCPEDKSIYINCDYEQTELYFYNEGLIAKKVFDFGKLDIILAMSHNFKIEESEANRILYSLDDKIIRTSNGEKFTPNQINVFFENNFSKLLKYIEDSIKEDFNNIFLCNTLVESEPIFKMFCKKFNSKNIIKMSERIYKQYANDGDSKNITFSAYKTDSNLKFIKKNRYLPGALNFLHKFYKISIKKKSLAFLIPRKILSFLSWFNRKL